ncbi:MAG: BadF/BadG/BcrA/BcrD ATPase family protein [Candidatus Acidiferrales bacterium]
MSYFLGFDGGGTKTDCVLLDAEGTVLRKAQGGPSNPLRAGYSRAWFAVSGAADAVMARQSLRAVDIRGICAGFGGAGRPSVAKRMSTFLQRSFPKAEVKVTTDIEIALAAAAGTGPGVVLMAGTGSAAYGRNSQGKVLRAGGWGPWLGDEGSAFDIGRRALTAVRRYEDGMGAATTLSDRVFRTVECRDWASMIERIVKNPDDVFPRIYPVVARAAEEGDAISRTILAGAAAALLELAEHVIRNLNLGDEKFPLVRSGGVFGHSEYLDSLVDTRLSEIASRATIGPLRTSPAEAAAQIARTAAGGAVGRAADAR